MGLSACVICYNEEENIGRCLESVSWVDELVVVDSLSRDDTVRIARSFTGKVYERPWEGYVRQKNFAVSEARQDWILSLDADEQVSKALREEILAVMARPEAKNGYWMPRCSFYQGRWIRHSGFYPDHQTRLFRRGKGRFVGGRVHERLEIEGPVGRLTQDLLHYPYHGGLTGQIDTVNRFSSLLAADLHDRGKRYGGHLLLLRPVFKFLEVYVLKRGFLDGTAGLIIAATSAYALFARYVKLREMEYCSSWKAGVAGKEAPGGSGDGR
ncbi:Glycosyltransferase, group 2 family protein [uncultured Desulfatiglans sp.]|uniref:Glycosyltransferase, group 2 family protein n=1 Tax=Uncultured Desulfatiglans sp. TaxID=1748965 RepID=A0A653AIR8_UNCDX|nr:Glycosyltransferase, group 2 family protein [uncultured Desulfatiglans sp.]